MIQEHNSPEGTGDRLSELFSGYKAAIPDVEASPAFMPELWARIDARRSFAFGLRRLARGLITAAAAICLVMGFFLARQEPTGATYLDVLASSQRSGDDTMQQTADVEIVRAAHERVQ